MFRLGYNTNGLAHHRPDDALRLLANLGYEAVALTPDVGALDPLHLRAEEVRSVARLAEDLGLALVVEGGARFVLDPNRKHRPNLMDEDPAGRARRVDLYRRLIDLAADLGAPVLSLWAGAAEGGATFEGGAPDADRECLLERLVDGLDPVLAHAAAAGVTVAFEPEPGMFVERPEGYRAVRDALRDRGLALALTLDVGHCVVTDEAPFDALFEEFASDLANVHLADCPRGLHEHRMFGEGDLDLPAALDALTRIGFRGVASVELSRDSHRGPDAAREALERVRAAAAERA